MREVLYEESAVSLNAYREESIYKILNVTGIVFFIISLIPLLMGTGYFFTEGETTQEDLFDLIINLFFFALFFTVSLILYFIKKKFNNSYDYIFVSGELRITKVCGNSRKPLYKINPDEILKVGRVDSRSYENLKFNRSLQEIRFTVNKTPAKDKEFYYMLYSDNVGKKIFIFECRETLIKNIAMYVSRDTMELE